jgi:cobalt/nickel transport system permease protein
MTDASGGSLVAEPRQPRPAAMPAMHRSPQAPGAALLHRLPAHVKLVAALAFVLLVVLTPGNVWWSWVVYAGVVAGLTQAAGLTLGSVRRAALIELPFLLFAMMLPLVVPGNEVEVLGLSLSADGLAGAWNLLAKATIGVLVSFSLAATTSPRELLAGLQRLRLPPLLVQIMTFMVRYLDVVDAELRRMHVARLSRGFVARDLRQWGVLARSAGALFIRSYERGERVHLAMLSRSYTGQLPLLGQPSTAGQWLVGAILPLTSALVCTAAWTLGG